MAANGTNMEVKKGLPLTCFLAERGEVLGAWIAEGQLNEPVSTGKLCPVDHRVAEIQETFQNGYITLAARFEIVDVVKARSWN